jgi:hypothetical protein
MRRARRRVPAVASSMLEIRVRVILAAAIHKGDIATGLIAFFDY